MTFLALRGLYIFFIQLNTECDLPFTSKSRAFSECEYIVLKKNFSAVNKVAMF